MIYVSSTANKHNDEIIYLQDRLSRLNSQIKTDITSPSYKYILKEIKSIENRMLNVDKTLISISIRDELKLIDEISRSYEDIITSANIDDLEFEEKKHMLNNILTSLYWNNSKVDVAFRK